MKNKENTQMSLFSKGKSLRVCQAIKNREIATRKFSPHIACINSTMGGDMRAYRTAMMCVATMFLWAEAAKWNYLNSTQDTSVYIENSMDWSGAALAVRGYYPGAPDYGVAITAVGGYRGLQVEGQYAVYATGSVRGVSGISEHGTGVVGSSTYGAGISGESLIGAGVNAFGATYGLDATATNGPAVRAVSTNSYGLEATSTNNTAIHASSTYGPTIDASASNTGWGVAIQAAGQIGVSSDVYTSETFGTTAAFQGTAYGYDNGNTYGLNVSVGNGNYAYGVYSNVWGWGVEGWSGFFTGDVYVGGYFDNPSDIMFKKNIRAIDGGLAKIMALKPKTYDMKVDEFKGRVSLPKGTQYGLIAQELETVMPELVHSVTAPAELSPEERKNKVKRNPTKFKSVNYMALIPVLIEAVQEQQAFIEKQQARIEALERGR